MSVRLVVCLVICGLLGCAGNSPAPIEDREGAQQQAVHSHTVKRGDTLYSIAFRYGMDFRKVAAANGIAPPYTIYPGQHIELSEAPPPVARAPASVYPATTYPATTRPATARPATAYPATSRHATTPRSAPAPSVPAVRAAPVPPPESPALPAGTPPVPPAATAATAQQATATRAIQEPAPSPVSAAPAATPGAPAPEVPAPSKVSTAQQAVAAVPAPAAPQGDAGSGPKAGAETFTGEKVATWRWPTSGPVIRGYSESVHKGIDIGGARGDAVTAVASGKVVYAGTGIAGFGELLIIKHNDVYLSAYGHNDELLVAEGDTVVAGQTIAQKGSSGTDAVKLHFEIRQEGKPIDPLRLLPGR